METMLDKRVRWQTIEINDENRNRLVDFLEENGYTYEMCDYDSIGVYVKNGVDFDALDDFVSNDLQGWDD